MPDPTVSVPAAPLSEDELRQMEERRNCARAALNEAHLRAALTDADRNTLVQTLADTPALIASHRAMSARLSARTAAHKDTPESIARQLRERWFGIRVTTFNADMVDRELAAALRSYGEVQRRVGATDMRERARQVADKERDFWRDDGHERAQHRTAACIAYAIAALPLEPKESRNG